MYLHIYIYTCIELNTSTYYYLPSSMLIYHDLSHQKISDPMGYSPGITGRYEASIMCFSKNKGILRKASTTQLLRRLKPRPRFHQGIGQTLTDRIVGKF